MKLYDHQLSGNSYKVRLLLSHLGIEYEKVTVDIFKGEHKSVEFTKLNPNQKIPVLVDEGHAIWESNAILLYLAKKYCPNQYLLDDPVRFGQMSQWLVFGKTSIDPYLAVARYFLKFLGEGNYDKDSVKTLHEQGNRSLAVMNDHLSKNDFLAGAYSIADIACYPYVMLSDEGGFVLSKYPEVASWCKRVESQQGFIGFEVV